MIGYGEVHVDWMQIDEWEWYSLMVVDYIGAMGRKIGSCLSFYLLITFIYTSKPIELLIKWQITRLEFLEADVV